LIKKLIENRGIDKRGDKDCRKTKTKKEKKDVDKEKEKKERKAKKYSKELKE